MLNCSRQLIAFRFHVWFSTLIAFGWKQPRGGAGRLKVGVSTREGGTTGSSDATAFDTGSGEFKVPEVKDPLGVDGGRSIDSSDSLSVK